MFNKAGGASGSNSLDNVDLEELFKVPGKTTEYNDELEKGIKGGEDS